MDTNEEGVFTVYRNKELVAIVKRDELTKSWKVYTTTEATGQDIVGLIINKEIKK